MKNIKTKTQHNKPIVLVTMGDPNGVGPEICARMFAKKSKHWSKVIPVLVGDVQVFLQALAMIHNRRSVKQIQRLTDPSIQNESSILVWNGGVPFTGKLQPGKVSRAAGVSSIGWVKRSVEEIQAGHAVAMVTAPICKESVEKAIAGFQGHTEFIGEMCGDPQPVLTLVHEKWVVAHVSTHVSLREAVDRVRQERIIKVGTLLNQFLIKYRKLKNPRLGVAGLNPHAGEGGLFGLEEIQEIAPAIQKLKKQKVQAIGPIPGDVVFPQMRAGHFDGVVAMYHDQGHVVTKTLVFGLGAKRKLGGVNLTLGLPVLRTSVDHGTGFDIAWQGKADAHSLMDAMDLAVTLSVD